MQLIQGKKYQAQIVLDGVERFASNGTIREKLTNAGFVNVEVTGSGGARSASGVWGKATQEASLPKQVKNVW